MKKKKICTLCGGTKFSDTALFQGTSSKYGSSFKYGRCDNCKSIICLSEVNIDYSGYITSVNFQKLKGRRLKKFFTLHDIGKNDHILDYGCGNGSFLETMKELGYHNIDGYEPHHEDYSKTISNKKFSVIYLVHVFEHITDLNTFFSDINRIAEEKCKLIIICPSSTRIPQLDPHDPFQKFVIHAPFHSFIPSDYILIKIFEKNNFTLRDLIHHDIVRSGFLANNNFSALMQDLLGGTKEDLLKSPALKIAGAVAKSPLKIFNNLFLDTRDDYVSTFIFER